MVRPDTDRPSLLLVSTVSVTIRHFLRPYADHFRSLGWRVDAAANGIAADPTAGAAFDAVHELALSRSLRDIGGLIRGWRGVARALDRARPDIVHVHTPIASFLVRLVARWMPAGHRPAVVYTAHGFHFHQAGGRLPNAIFLAAERLAGRWTDRLIVINDEDEQAARRHRIVPAPRLVRMPGIGLDTAAFSPASIDPDEAARSQRRLGLPDDAAYFAVIGELNWNKRQADAIDALATMRNRQAHLLVIGSGPMRPGLEVLATERKVSDRVHFSGFIEDVPTVLSGALALVATSAREGLSRSVMEALSLEVPVIASTARGNRELVGDSGRIFPTGDVPALAGWMDWFVDHPRDGRAMGRTGRRRMVEEYDLQELIRRHERLYLGLLAERGRLISGRGAGG